MKITEFKNKIVIAELKSDRDYIVLVNREQITPEQIRYVKRVAERTRDIPFIAVKGDLDKVIRFIQIPKRK